MLHEISFAKRFLRLSLFTVDDFFFFSFSFSLIDILTSALIIFLSRFSQIALLNEISNSYFIRKCDTCEVCWERMRS